MSGTITESAAQPVIAETSTRVEPSSPEIEPSQHDRREVEASGLALVAGFGLVLALALAALVPTTGDFGLTWDEPAYRYSQIISAQWWEQLWHARSWDDIRRSARTRRPALLLALRQVTGSTFTRRWPAS